MHEKAPVSKQVLTGASACRQAAFCATYDPPERWTFAAASISELYVRCVEPSGDDQSQV